MSEEAPIEFEYTGVSEEALTVLQDQILTSTIPSTGDGITNAWRTYYICEVFEVQQLDLRETFPYSATLGCKDIDKVTAAIHLAKMQFQFNESCAHLGYCDADDADMMSCWLHHMIRLMVHHSSHLKRGRPTPPIGFH